MSNQEKSTKILAHSTGHNDGGIPWLKPLLGIPHHVLRFYPETGRMLRIIGFLMAVLGVFTVLGGAFVFVQIFTDSWYNYVAGALFGFVCAWVIRFGFITRRPSPGNKSNSGSFWSFIVHFCLFGLLLLPVALGLCAWLESEKVAQIRSSTVEQMLTDYRAQQSPESDPQVRALGMLRQKLLEEKERLAISDSSLEARVTEAEVDYTLALESAEKRMEQNYASFANQLAGAHFPVTEWKWIAGRTLFYVLLGAMSILFILITILHYRLIVKRTSIISNHLRVHDRKIIQTYFRSNEEQLTSFIKAKFGYNPRRPPIYDDAPFGVIPSKSFDTLEKKTF